jgi:hypothetical protein
MGLRGLAGEKTQLGGRFRRQKRQFFQSLSCHIPERPFICRKGE